jgi:hypothetical protein
LLSQLEDDPLRTTDVAELAPPKVLYLAEAFRPFLFHARNDSFDILDGECDVRDAQSIRRKLSSPITRSTTAPLYFPLSYDFESQVEKKRLGGSKIVHDDTHMIYSMDFQIFYSLMSCEQPLPL